MLEVLLRPFRTVQYARRLALGIATLALVSCAHTADDMPNQPKALQESTLGAALGRQPVVLQDTSNLGTTNATDTVFESNLPQAIKKIPVIAQHNSYTDVGRDRTPPPLQTSRVDAYVAPLSLPQFIDAVFGEMLGTPYVTGPEVAARTDVVQLRSSGEMQATDFLELVIGALEEYGVRVLPENGTYRIIEDKDLRSRIPKFIKSRARLRTPSDLRPVIQFVELRAVDANSMLELLQKAFGRNSDKLIIQANPRLNTIILNGLPEDVNAALDIIHEMDELSYAGTLVKRYTPRYWAAEELSQELERALDLEGWEVTSGSVLEKWIALMPVAYSNDIFVFAKSELAHERVAQWIKDLDRPVQGGDTEQIFVYQVKNVDAVIMAETANAVLSSGDGDSRAGPVAALGAPPLGPSAGPSGGIFFTVDPVGNRIIFTGTANDYDKLVSLLRQLDTPAPEVLIEIMIAEVTLTDDSSFGVEFFLNNLGPGNVQTTVQSGGLGLGNNGLNIGFLSGNVDASINAFASNRQVKLLSRPTLIARSGGSAQLQVGLDVPIITSQRAADNQTGSGPTDILQSIEYRKTGVLMSIEPIVFSQNRIDLTISQEVSSTVATANATIASPTISNRSISTQLSLEDGQTAVLGGLIQEDFIRTDTGVPVLKDLPIVGQAFSVDGISVTRTELVVLITAYVLRGQEDRAHFVREMSGRLDKLILDEERLVTLLPKQF